MGIRVVLSRGGISSLLRGDPFLLHGDQFLPGEHSPPLKLSVEDEEFRLAYAFSKHRL